MAIIAPVVDGKLEYNYTDNSNKNQINATGSTLGYGRYRPFHYHIRKLTTCLSGKQAGAPYAVKGRFEPCRAWHWC